MTSASLRSRPSGFASGSSAPSLIERTRRVLQYRRIMRLLVARDLKVRYAGSFLGYLWTILDPLLMSLVYWFVFTQVFHRNAGPDYAPYMLYLVAGQLPWYWFNGGVQGASRALRSEAQMVRSTNVPRELWVIRVVLSKYIEYIFGLPVLVIFALAYMARPTWYVLLLPLGWLIEVTLLMGVGLILAPLNVLVRDIERIVPIVLRLLFYASPVLYSIEQAPTSLRSLYTFNPTVGFLQLSRAAFFPAALYEKREKVVGAHVVIDSVRTHITKGKPVVTTKAHLVGGHTVIHTVSHWNWIWHSAVVAFVILVIGGFVFMRLERHVLKEI
jgi:ABC-2 type transport system permease protein